MRQAGAAVLLLLTACGSAAKAPPSLSAGGASVSAHYPACVAGSLTQEGLYCRALRGDDGMLYALAGPLRGFGPGDAVCVCGYVPGEQFCKQGTTFIVSEIDTTCAAIR